MTDMPSPTLDVKRKQWLEALHGSDRHAVIQQLIGMSWDAASFRIVNEARGLAPSAPEGGIQLNGLMHSLIDRGFFTRQMVAVRRLMDSYPLEGKKGVYSLAGLLEDMQNHRNLLTRKAIFDAESLVYDYEPVRQKFFEYAKVQAANGKSAYGVPPELFYERYERRHEVIDILTGVTVQSRRPTDVIQESVLVNLSGKATAACDDIIDHVTKFIAHAATPESRAIANADDIKVTLGHLWTAHRHLCQVVGFLAIYVLGDSCPSFLPAPAFDQFLYMDRPLVDTSQIEQLRQLWNEFDGDCHNWSQWDLDSYTQEFS